MSGRLIINADDFGLTPGINRAVAELHGAGVLTSVTLMANGPAFAGAVAVASANPGLGVGCHIVLTGGHPVSHPESIPSLLGGDGKTFRPSLIDFFQALLRGHIAEAEIEREVLAQIQKLQRAGIDVSHVDTHKHTHIFPAVARPLLRIAERCGVRAVRYPFEPAWSSYLSQAATPVIRRLALRGVGLLEPRFRSLLDLTRDEVTTSGTLGIAATGNLNAETLLCLLNGLARQTSSNRLDPVYELCCHPGYNDAALNVLPTRLRRERDTEREALLSIVPAWLETHNIELTNYGTLGIPGQQRAAGHFVPNRGDERLL